MEWNEIHLYIYRIQNHGPGKLKAKVLGDLVLFLHALMN